MPGLRMSTRRREIRIVLDRGRVRADEKITTGSGGRSTSTPSGPRREGVAVEHRARAEPRQIGSRPWLGEALAPDIVGREDRGQEPLPLRLGPPLHDPGARQHQADGVHAGGAPARTISSWKIIWSTRLAPRPP